MAELHNDIQGMNNLNEILNVLDLPDIFMISVFRLFSLKDRLKYASVCKKWNNLIKDGSLWTTIDLREYKNSLNLINLKKLISVYGNHSSKLLMLCGNYFHDFTSNFKNLAITNDNDNSDNIDYKKLFYLDYDFFDMLSIKSFNMHTMYLEYLDLSDINFQVFQSFVNLKKLSLKWCNIKDNWFDTENKYATRISQLYLIRTGKLTLNDIENICQRMPLLNALTIVQAQSTISDEAVELIANNLKHLEQLELTNTFISDNAIFSICNSSNLCKNLKHLNLSMSSCLTNNCLLSIAENLTNLKSLYLTSCFGISNVILLQNFINLNYLNLNNTSIDREKIRELLLPMLPKCEVEFGHEKMLNRKLMWTINGSRNCVCSF